MLAIRLPIEIENRLDEQEDLYLAEQRQVCVRAGKEATHSLA